MKRISAAELIRNFGLYGDAALNEPVIVTKHGRERLVLMNVNEFNLLAHNADIGKEAIETKGAARKAARKGSKASRRMRKTG